MELIGQRAGSLPQRFSLKLRHCEMPTFAGETLNGVQILLYLPVYSEK